MSLIDKLKNRSTEENVANPARRKRFILWLTVLLLLVSVLAYLLKPQSIEVDTYTIKQQALLVSIDEEGQTRVKDVYTFSAPVAGKLERIELEVGDLVVANETQLLTIHPQSPDFLNVRSEKQAKAVISTARSALRLSKAELDKVQADLKFRQSEYQRAVKLSQEAIIPEQQLEDAEHLLKAVQAELASAHAKVQMRNFEVKQAEAMLLKPADSALHADNCQCVPMTSAIGGQILKVIDPSERNVVAGEDLLEIGNADDLEIVVDLLSVDAVKVEVGDRVIINDWGGTGKLHGQVSRIEPFGYTKVSALGIEEQRVNVLVDIISDKALWQRLGHAYQVGIKVVLWESDSVITVPLTAVFRKKLDLKNAEENHWAVFVIEDGKVKVRDIQIGQRSGLDAEVLTGLSENEIVVLHPSNKVKSGVRAVDRSDVY